MQNESQLPTTEFRRTNGILEQRIEIIRHRPGPNGEEVGIRSEWKPVNMTGETVSAHSWVIQQQIVPDLLGGYHTQGKWVDLVPYPSSLYSLDYVKKEKADFEENVKTTHRERAKLFKFRIIERTTTDIIIN